METMLVVVNKYLSENEKATFIQIFTQVKLILKDKWRQRFPDKSMEEIETKKRGELFGYLNTDGRFIKVSKKHWALTHNYSYEEIKKLRINIGENED